MPSLREKIVSLVRYILPLGGIIFLVTGLIFLGVATPTEAAATGALGTFILALGYRRFNWGLVKKSVGGTVRITSMSFLIVAGAVAFSQILSFTGASRGAIEFAIGLPLPPILVIIVMQVILLIMGAFMNFIPIMMVTIPLFFPVVYALGFNPIWFAVVMVLNGEMAMTTPPFGMVLFVMKGVAPLNTTMDDIYKAALPFLGCDLLVMILLIAFPALTLWLPGLMR